MEQNNPNRSFYIGFTAGFLSALIIALAFFAAFGVKTQPTVAAPAVSSSEVSSQQPQSQPKPQSSSPASVTSPDVKKPEIVSSKPPVASSEPVSSAVSQPARDYPGEFSVLRDSAFINEPDDEHIQLLFGFFDDYYQSLGKLRSNDITDWFYPLSAAEHENMLLNQTALQVLCAIRAERETDLTFDEFRYGITFTGYEKLPDGRIEITLLEDSRQKFDFLDGISSFSSGIEHTFLLTKDDNGHWRISLHDRDEDIFIRIWERYCEKRKSAKLFDIEKAPELFEQVYDEFVNAAIEDEKERVSQLEQYEEGDRVPANSYNWRYNYNREKAVDYAETWTDGEAVIRNAEWPLYDGNCQNFVSQCLFAGGVPMDATGANQWKWCGNAINTAQKMAGRSASWAGVDDFYNYSKYNDDKGGLVAQVDASLCKAQPGDILQLGAFGEWYHSVIITEVVYDGDQPVDFLVASNTTDHLSYPVSAYPYTAMRLIKIYGYN